MFAYRDLERLSDAEARLALVAPAAQLDVKFEAAAIKLILEASAEYPHFVQEYGRVLWNEVETSPIRARESKSAQALISEALTRRFFRDGFETATDAEQRYMAAMAELGDGPVETRDAATRAGYKANRSTCCAKTCCARISSTARAAAGWRSRFPCSPAMREQHPLARFDE